MFKFDPNPTFWWPIKVRVPSALVPGQYDTQEFRALFRLRGTADIEAVARAIADLPEAERYAATLTDTSSTIIDWADVVDGDGRAVPFSAAQLRALLDHPAVMRAVQVAWAEAVYGGGAARKN
jgi:hypothetical protein